MRFRYLRIAWPVAWAVAAVLLCVLWVRSYWWADHIVQLSATSVTTHVCFDTGVLFFTRAKTPGAPSPFANVGWRHTARPPAGVGDSHKNLKSYWVDGEISVRIPIVSATFLLIVAGTTPWLPYNRFSYKQFSLRTLLIAVTLGSVGLGIILWLLR
jgi:hypothetical protein